MADRYFDPALSLAAPAWDPGHQVNVVWRAHADRTVIHPIAPAMASIASEAAVGRFIFTQDTRDAGWLAFGVPLVAPGDSEEAVRYRLVASVAHAVHVEFGFGSRPFYTFGRVLAFCGLQDTAAVVSGQWHGSDVSQPFAGNSVSAYEVVQQAPLSVDATSVLYDVDVTFDVEASADRPLWLGLLMNQPSDTDWWLGIDLLCTTSRLRYIVDHGNLSGVRLN